MTAENREQADPSAGIEGFLTAAVVAYHRTAGGGGGHPGKFSVLLSGGLTVLVKPAVDDNTKVQAANEEAAWVIAKALGWGDLVPAVARRQLTDPMGQDVAGSVHVLLPGVDVHSGVRAIGDFSDEDQWRAAVYDYVVQQHDRRSNNWVFMTDHDGKPRLHLVDHGNAFGYGGDALNSDWTDSKSGQQLPTWCQEALAGLREASIKQRLEDLLGVAECEALFTRVAGLLSGEPLS